ncbi:hypothetical protein EN781_15200, partial [Mesorhizobium sp. M4A.F.Ca.ET.090.04.2.1]
MKLNSGLAGSGAGAGAGAGSGAGAGAGAATVSTSASCSAFSSEAWMYLPLVFSARQAICLPSSAVRPKPTTSA